MYTLDCVFIVVCTSKILYLRVLDLLSRHRSIVGHLICLHCRLQADEARKAAGHSGPSIRARACLMPGIGQGSRIQMLTGRDVFDQQYNLNAKVLVARLLVGGQTTSDVPDDSAGSLEAELDAVQAVQSALKLLCLSV